MEKYLLNGIKNELVDTISIKPRTPITNRAVWHRTLCCVCGRHDKNSCQKDPIGKPKKKIRSSNKMDGRKGQNREIKFITYDPATNIEKDGMEGKGTQKCFKSHIFITIIRI